MKIRQVQIFRAVSPLSGPIADSTHQISEIAFIVTRIHTQSGHTGEAYLLAFHYSPNAILGALRDIKEMALGWDVSDPSGFRNYFERESEYFGNPGIHRWALGSINIAMWDASARARGLPAWNMAWESYAKDDMADRVPLYGSGGWLSYSVDELVEEVKRYVRLGFRAVKVKVGLPSLEADVERLTRVREAVGADVDLMMDANQGLDLAGALAISSAVKPLRITWFEEPLSNTDYEGYATLSRETDLQLAMGEREFNTVALGELVKRKAIDLWQPDILRLGGVEGWIESANLASTYGIPVLPHFYKEYDVPLMMGVQNACGCESFDWVDPLIDHPITVSDGFAYPHQESGWGFRFKEEFLTEIA